METMNISLLPSDEVYYADSKELLHLTILSIKDDLKFSPSLTLEQRCSIEFVFTACTSYFCYYLW